MKLSVSQRLRLLSMLQSYQGNIVDLKIVNGLNSKLGFDEDELKKYNLIVSDGRISWDDNVEDKDVEIGDRANEIIGGLLKERDGKAELTVADISIWDLFVGDK